MLPWIALTTLFLAGLLFASYHDRPLGVWLTKPIASLGFIGAAIAAGALESGGHGALMLLGLLLSMLGDVLLIPKDREPIFRAGILAFLLGHVAYLAAFVQLGLDPLTTAIAFAGMAGPAWLIIRWLRPNLSPDMVIPVYAYVVVISGMMITAVGSLPSSHEPRIPLGALMFLVSDISVARDRFVIPSFANGAWGLPLYYGGQLVLASTAGLQVPPP